MTARYAPGNGIVVEITVSKLRQYATMGVHKRSTAYMDAMYDHPETAMTLGAMIRQARERAGLSLRHVEAITGIPRPTLNRLERDEIDNPNPDLFPRLADALELNSEDLFAFLGYRPSSSLPSLVPYLRTKYHLPPAAIAQAHQALRDILEHYDQTHRDEPASDRPDRRAAPDDL